MPGTSLSLEVSSTASLSEGTGVLAQCFSLGLRPSAFFTNVKNYLSVAAGSSLQLVTPNKIVGPLLQ